MPCPSLPPTSPTPPDPKGRPIDFGRHFGASAFIRLAKGGGYKSRMQWGERRGEIWGLVFYYFILFCSCDQKNIPPSIDPASEEEEREDEKDEEDEEELTTRTKTSQSNLNLNDDWSLPSNPIQIDPHHTAKPSTPLLQSQRFTRLPVFLARERERERRVKEKYRQPSDPIGSSVRFDF